MTVTRHLCAVDRDYFEGKEDILLMTLENNQTLKPGSFYC